ncbi:AAA family ATPase [Neisseria subflava]|uniref:ATP-binding protein n=1 Tax=Neisseria subflava TaxID=28449 RepID=A0A9X9HZS5_NEISU|nr:ATP-binding protein [Neisseria subflava]UTG72642.1 ATP-binding protein [Neisseria subflava]
MKDSDQIGQDIINGVATGIGLKLLTDEKYSSDDSFLRQNKEFQGLKNVKIFRIDPFTIKNRRSTGNNPGELNCDGSNIAAVLEKLEKDNELREQIIEWMSVIVPEMKKVSVRTQNIDSSKGLFFEEDSGNRFPAHMVSDGTIYALCLLVAVLTRVKQPGITIIEEPERGLHPKAISELIGFIREYASPHHPIILTTHSESVVRSLELEELYFVSKSQGKTQIKDVRKSGVDKNKIPLDTAWLTNLLGEDCHGKSWIYC